MGPKKKKKMVKKIAVKKKKSASRPVGRQTKKPIKIKARPALKASAVKPDYQAIDALVAKVRPRGFGPETEL